ncbi:MAG: citrate lyase holo-[acyl-carrier protein] synthase [Hespellia sp.]|nr:citrate lyase holo-[acyl-carrier protein] synthase [Hespellia sp.]
MLHGIKVALPQMLDCRERRAEKQTDYLYTYHMPVISFCMNIPGPVKTTPEIRQVFLEGVALIDHALEQESIRIMDSVTCHVPTGDEYILCIDCSDAEHIKTLMTDIEESHPLGRLFDIDVIGIDGIKLSRPSFRKCFLCDRQAQECASSRRHSVREMQDAIEQKIHDYYHCR